MYLSMIENWKYGTSIKHKKTSVYMASSLVENLRCHNEDDYPVISSDEDGPVPPLACRFSKLRNTSHILALVDESGSLVLYNTNISGENAYITGWTVHNNAVFDIEWNCCENKLLTASGDQSLALWDVNTQSKLLNFKGHSSSVRTVNYRPQDNAVFVSGSRDGHVRMWDSRCNIKNKIVSCIGVIKNAHSTVQTPAVKRRASRIRIPHSQDSQQSVTCVLFQNDNLLVTSGAVDGCVKVWDVRKIKPNNNDPVNSFPYTGTSKRTHGYSSLVFDSCYSRLYASCTDDVIYAYDFISYKPEPVCTYRGHRKTSFYVKAVLSPDDQFLLSGSGDDYAYIWQVSNPSLSPVILKGHTSEVSDVAWCKTDMFRIVTASDDNTMRVWRYDATAPERKKLGKPDDPYGIVGTAERTHRDIGTSVETPKTPQRSPGSALKRAATLPFGPVTQLTPKRPRTCLSSTPSPSIKIWLKRAASEPLASTSNSETLVNTSNSESMANASNSESLASTSKTLPGSDTSESTDSAITNKPLISSASEKTNDAGKNQLPISSNHDNKNHASEIEALSYRKTESTENKTESALETAVDDKETAVNGSDNDKNAEKASNACTNNSDLSENNTQNNTQNSAKKRRLESKENDANSTTVTSQRKSCKRKLTDIDNEMSPKKQKKQKIDFENARIGDENSGAYVGSGEIESQSPRTSPMKRGSPLKDLDSEINKSPVKHNLELDSATSPRKLTTAAANLVTEDGKSLEKLYESPLKSNENMLCFTSPARVSVLDWGDRMYQSPTANLPNIVIDGPSTNQKPEVQEVSKKKTVDWLTQMRIQKLSKQKVAGKCGEDKVPAATDEVVESTTTPVTPSRIKNVLKGINSIASFFTRPDTKS